jgi:hypothetical protein
MIAAPAAIAAQDSTARTQAPLFNGEIRGQHRIGVNDIPAGRRVQPAPRPSVRLHEYISAPYLVDGGGPAGSGEIVGTGEVHGVPLTESLRPLQIQERIFLTLPKGRAATVGDRYVVLASGPSLRGVGQVVIPAGIVAVERAQAGQAVEGRIVAKLGDLRIGQRLVPLDATVPPPSTQPNPVSGAPKVASALWIGGEPELATLQYYVLLDAGTNAGLKQGDQVTFYREKRQLSSGVVLPASDIAVAQVVRVGPRSSTAIVIAQDYPAITVGKPARLTAKMP